MQPFRGRGDEGPIEAQSLRGLPWVNTALVIRYSLEVWAIHLNKWKHISANCR